MRLAGKDSDSESESERKLMTLVMSCSLRIHVFVKDDPDDNKKEACSLFLLYVEPLTIDMDLFILNCHIVYLSFIQCYE